MTFEQVILEVSYGMSEMAANHKNDMISNALASLADRLTRMKDKKELTKLSSLDKDLIRYYHIRK